MTCVYCLVNFLALLALGYSATSDGGLAGIFDIVLVGVGAGSLMGVIIEARRPPPLVRAKGDRVSAVYHPPRGVIEGLECLIGKPLVWEAVWKIDRGRDRGQWAMRPTSGDDREVHWVPLNDLVVGDRRRERG